MGSTAKTVFLATVLIATFSSAYGIRCNSCQSDILNNRTCEENNRVIQCGYYYDACFSMRAVIDVPGLGERHMEVKNCSVSSFCPRLQNVTCSNLEHAVPVKECEVRCCYGDLCNGASLPNTTARPVATTRPWWWQTTKPWWQRTTQPWWQKTTRPWWWQTTKPWWQRTTQPWWQRTTQPWWQKTTRPWWWQTTKPWWQRTTQPWWQRTTQPWWQKTTRPWWWQTTKPWWWQTTKPWWWKTTVNPLKCRINDLLDQAQLLLFKIKALLRDGDLYRDADELSLKHKRDIDKILSDAESHLKKKSRAKRDLSVVEEIRKIRDQAEKLVARKLRK